jgi:hypothetical protein
MLRVVSMDGQGNWVRTPDGTAAVCVESILVDENQSLGKPEKAKNGREVIYIDFKNVSQKTYKERKSAIGLYFSGR